jgi:anti-anti-sigma regulatory factor
MLADSASRIPLQLSRGRVIASIQVEVTEPILERLRADLLNFVAKHNASSLIVDLAGVALLDLEEFNHLLATLDMVRVLGAAPIICGLQPGLVSALVDLGVNTSDIQAAANLDHAVEILDGSESAPGRPGFEEQDDAAQFEPNGNLESWE